METRVHIQVFNDYILVRFVEIKELRLSLDDVSMIINGIESKSLSLNRLSVNGDRELIVNFIIHLLNSREDYDRLKTWIRQHKQREMVEAYLNMSALRRQRSLEIEAMRDR